MGEREQILNAIEGIPAVVLLKYIKDGKISFADLEAHGLDNWPDKRDYILKHLSEEEEKFWTEVEAQRTISSYAKYLSIYPNGKYLDQARAAIANEESEIWNDTMKRPSIEGLEQYKRLFPEGTHIAQCLDLLSDSDWLDALISNTIQSYEAYRINHPEKRSDEVQAAIDNIQEAIDWDVAENSNTISSYKEYLNKWPNGKHAIIAKERINRPPMPSEKILEDLRHNKNAYSAYQLQEKVGNKLITWDSLLEVFTPAQIMAIQNWKSAAQLPATEPPTRLQKDSTEVYFWGTKGTGKTCVLGSILSAAKRSAILEKQDCKARLYLDQLSNIFTLSGNTQICNLPDSTPDSSISEMVVKLEDSKQRQHKMTLVDLAGEAVTGLYKKNCKLPLMGPEEKAVKNLLTYLNDQHNNKIHFFILEYGSANKFVKTNNGNLDITQCDVLADLATFLNTNGCFKKSTVGIYVLVTKCDLIDVEMGTSPEERPKLAYEYVKENFPSFFNQLKKVSERNKVSEFKTFAYSIGDVFVENLCTCNSQDSNKIINQLILKTRPEWRFWDWLFN